MSYPAVTPEEYTAHMVRVSEKAGLRLQEIEVPTEWDVIANGIRLHCVDWGRADRQPVLFLHGGGLQAHSWDLVAQVLRQGYHCLALDQRGHGKSEWSPSMDYRCTDYAADCLDLIEKLALRYPILIGTSMGAVNALTCAVLRPDRVAGLVLIDLPVSDAVVPGRLRLRSFLSEDVEMDSMDDLVARGAIFNRRRSPGLLSTTMKWNSIQLPNGKWTMPYDKRHRCRHDIWAILQDSRKPIFEQLGQVACPTLLIRGADSDVVSPNDLQMVADRLPEVQIAEVPGAGHNVHGDNPKDTVAVVHGFLDGLHTSTETIGEALSRSAGAGWR